MSATYSPEDNKLRLYVGRVPRDEYEKLRAQGWTSTPKQSCDFVAVWTPGREDTALEYADEIGDEDYSATERAADRAERFEEYRDKRADEAGVSADVFEAGPQVFGHQSAARAERQARRHDRARAFACSQWSKAEYWQTRTAGVIRNALHRAAPHVRRGRILTLEAEHRKHQKTLGEYAERYATWEKVLTLEDGTMSGTYPNYNFTSGGAKLAYALSVNGRYGGNYKHPRRPDDKPKCLYSLFSDAIDPLTAHEVARLWLASAERPGNPDSWSARWSRHYELRLAYERQMLEAEGGTVAAADMEPGGWICTSGRTGNVFTSAESGWSQIHAVVRSPATKRVTSVKIMGMIGYRHDNQKPGLVLINVERLGEDAYRAPTDEERAAFKVATKERKAKEKATRPEPTPLINPTDEDAEKLLAALNARPRSEDDKPSQVMRMTQKQYSELSKGTYSKAETRTVHQYGGIMAEFKSDMWSERREKFKAALGPEVCKVRIYGYRPANLVIITDKPQKPLPLNWDILGTVKPEETGRTDLFAQVNA